MGKIVVFAYEFVGESEKSGEQVGESENPKDELLKLSTLSRRLPGRLPRRLPGTFQGPSRELIGRFSPMFPMFLTFLGDFTPGELDSRRLQTLSESKNRVLLEEYYIFNVVIPPEVE